MKIAIIAGMVFCAIMVSSCFHYKEIQVEEATVRCIESKQVRNLYLTRWQDLRTSIIYFQWGTKHNVGEIKVLLRR